MSDRAAGKPGGAAGEGSAAPADDPTRAAALPVDRAAALPVDRADRRRTELILLTVVAAWGLTFPAIKAAVAEVPPGLFMALRMGLVLVALVAIGRGRYAQGLAPVWKDGLLLGFLLWASYLFQAVGLAHTTATRSAFITGLSVVIVPLIDIPYRRRAHGWRVVAGIVLSLIGLFLMTRPDAGQVNLGDILTLGTALSYAIYVILIGRRSHDANSNALIGWQALVMAGASILAMPLLDGGIAGGISGAAATGPFRLDSLSLPALLRGHPGLLIGLAITVPVAVFSIIAITQIQRRTTAVRAGILYSAEPLFAAVFAALWLGERLDPAGMLGAALILAGILTTVFD